MPRMEQLFLTAVERVPQRTFVRRLRDGEDTRTTYLEACTLIHAVATALREQGVAPKERVVCLLDDIEQSLFLMLGCSFAGAAFLPLAANTSEAARSRSMARVGARVVLTTRELAPAIAKEGVPTLSFGRAEDRPVNEHDKILPRPPAIDPSAALEGLRRLANESDRSSEDEYVILMTSGSTGEPKLVVRSHKSFADYALLRLADFGPGPYDERHLLCSGLMHGLAQTNLSIALGMASEICVPTQMEGATGLDDVRRLDPTLAQPSPRVVKTLYQQHVSRGGTEKEPLFGPSFRSLRTAGASIPQELLQYVAAHGADVGEFYGTSETSHIAHTPPGGWRPGLVGQILPCVDAKIADDGEILVRTPYMMNGYLGDEKATRDAFTEDGYYKTGDVGEIDQDGYLRLLGRKKDVFNAPDGTNLFPATIEDEIRKCEWVKQAVLFGDGRPFLTAIISIVEDGTPAPDGTLPVDGHAALYDRAARALAEINQRREVVERVRRFILFGGKTTLYEQSQIGKPMVHRKAMLQKYADQVNALYDASSRVGVVPT